MKFFLNLIYKLFGSKHERDIKKMRPAVNLINCIEAGVFFLSDDEIKAKTRQFKEVIKTKNYEEYIKGLKEQTLNAFNKIKNFNEEEIQNHKNRLEERIRFHYKNHKDIFPQGASGSVVLSSFTEKRIAANLIEFEKNLKELFKKIKEGDAEREFTSLFDEYFEGGKETLDILLPESFAVVREASLRTLNLRHFDVQIMGGIVLHNGKIAEMKTGEGKTLVATLALYLNALEGKGAHLITVNDYLARRDSSWMGVIYKFLELSVGLIYSHQPADEKRTAYAADITYGTNNEFGFDYLRDNMAKFKEQCAGREEFNYAIVDEVDSVLIDEARTPLIISGPSEENIGKYVEADRLVRRLKKEKHYLVDEKEKNSVLTEDGVKKAEEILCLENLYDIQHIDLIHAVNQSLKAHNLFKRDVDYLIKDGQVIIVDEFTGRLMEGRRWSDGLHQAVEAKEGVKIEQENQTLATVTFQNFFKMYNKLSGMTGTADTEAVEFNEIYGLDVNVIPPNKKIIRDDFDDAIYGSQKEKYDAIVNKVKEVHASGRPLLLGTISIETSEFLSARLRRENIPHSVLNAKYHEKEAEIISRAGQKAAVTIATNMAGRGTDIVLGDGVAEAGGLYVLGSSRHEARRIDNQLRGRSGRQGDPGTTEFYVSLDDDLMRLFAPEGMWNLVRKTGLNKGEKLSHPLISRALERAQKKVEGVNFEIRKNLLEFDNVMNQQRSVVYKERKKALWSEDIKDYVLGMLDDVAEGIVYGYCPLKVHRDDYDREGLSAALFTVFRVKIDKEEFLNKEVDEIFDFVLKLLQNIYREKEERIGADILRRVEKFILLEVVDKKWKDHLYNMDHLKSGIGLRAYGQKDPIVEYKNESARIFNAMIESIKEDVLSLLFKIKDASKFVPMIAYQDLMFKHDSLSAMDAVQKSQAARQTAAKRSPSPSGPKIKPVVSGVKTGRNDPCPCGSGKKYKQCCLR